VLKLALFPAFVLLLYTVKTDAVPGHLSQLASSTPNITASLAFYEAIGFQYSGTVPGYVRPLVLKTGMIQEIMGLPDLKNANWLWQVPNGQDFFQLEILEFIDPPGRSLNRTAADIGISRCGIFVTDFEGAMQRLSKLGYSPMTSVMNFTGYGSRVTFQDPAGGVVELMDTDLDGFQSNGTAVRTITMTVPNLQRSMSYLNTIFGFEETEFKAHTVEMEKLWGLEGAVRDLVTMRDNSSTVLVEYAHYTHPEMRPRPAGEIIKDHGFTHVVGHATHDYSTFESTYSR